MIAAEQRLRVNVDEVAAEVIDAEAVLINLSTGMYYTMDKVGAVVWQLIEGGHSMAEMSSIIAERYGVDPDMVLRDLEKVVRDLLEQRLVAVEEGRTAPMANAADTPRDVEVYARPTLCKYTDMAEVLALDPPLPVLRERPWKKPE